MGDLHSYQWYGVREVFLKKLNDLISCGDLLKLLKGHEEGAGKRLVLNWRIKKLKINTVMLALILAASFIGAFFTYIET